MNNKLIIGSVVILVVIFAAGYIFVNQNRTTNPSFTPTGSAVSNASEESAAGTEQSLLDENLVEVTVESRGLSFTPSEIRVKQGQVVRLTYKNTMGSHDWVVDEFDVRTPIIEANQESTVTFVANKTGTFEFYCSVPGHRQSGMKGSLIVE